MRQSLCFAKATALLLLCAVAQVSAVYEDQAGQYDWLKEHVGRVKLAQLVSQPRDRLYVASEAGVIAALSPADGSLRWRRVLAEGDACSHLLVVGPRVLTLTDGGKQLLAWVAESGAAAWTAAVATGELGGGTDMAAVGGNAVAVAINGAVKAYAVSDGRALWTVELTGSSTRLFSAHDDGIVAASLDGSTLRLAHISSDGQLSQQASLEGGTQLSGSQLVAGSGAVAALSSDGAKLCGAERTASSLSCQRLTSLLPDGTDVAGAQLVPGSCGQHAVLQVAGGAAVLALGGSSGVSVVKFVPGATASGCFQGAAHSAGPLVALATPSTSGLHVQVVSATDGGSVQQDTVADLAPRRVDGTPVGVAALFAAPTPTQSSFRHLAVLDDDSLALVEGGRAAWVRHEELASVADVLFTDLPAPSPENEAQWLASQPSLAETLRAQALSLKVQASQMLNVPLASPEERAAVERYKAVTSDKLRPTRDPGGSRKQLVVLTKRGKVLSLHNGDGHLLWSLDFGPAAAPSRLALWRVPHDVQHDVEVVAFAVGGGATTATVINAHTGAVQQTLSAPFEAADLLRLPHPAHDGTADQHVFVLVPPGVGSRAAILPDTPQAREAAAAQLPSMTFWRVDEAAGAVRGFGSTADGEVEERWTAVLAAPGGPHRLLTAVGLAPGEAIYSPARVLGSGELKFKYLNPNIVLAAVGLPRAGQAGEGDARLTVVLLDGVTGRILFSQTHEGATGPVHAVLSENMAAYHFWSTEAHRWQMAAAEVFDASPPSLRVVDLAFSETNTTASSWDVPQLEVNSQGFLARLPVVGLGVTRSARGSAARQVLLLTPAGQVCQLDRRFLDPRRPILPPGQKPSAEQAAEGLPPYQPELPLAGPMFATLDRRVARLRGVALEAAELESTQLLLAHGLDLFYTRLTPSKTFDMVPDDFPYALLVLMVVSLTAATVVLSMLQKRGITKAKWQ